MYLFPGALLRKIYVYTKQAAANPRAKSYAGSRVYFRLIFSNLFKLSYRRLSVVKVYNIALIGIQRTNAQDEALLDPAR